MDTVKGILLILTILFGTGAFILYVQLAASNNQLENAKETNAVVLQFLQAQRVTDCGSNPTDYGTIARCVRPLLLQKDFKEDGFAKGDVKTGAGGYIIVKNVNRKTYDAERFSLYKNRVLEQQGCTIPGVIDYNVACRFNFASYCQDGDVLEVKYASNGTGTPTDVKVFTKNC